MTWCIEEHTRHHSASLSEVHGAPPAFMEHPPPPLPHSTGHWVYYTVPRHRLWNPPPPQHCTPGGWGVLRLTPCQCHGAMHWRSPTKDLLWGRGGGGRSIKAGGVPCSTPSVQCCGGLGGGGSPSLLSFQSTTGRAYSPGNARAERPPRGPDYRFVAAVLHSIRRVQTAAVARDVLEEGGGGGGGGGVWLGPPSSLGLPMVPTEGGPNPLCTEGAEAKLWLSASNIGRGGGGGFGMTPWCDDLVCSWRRLLAGGGGGAGRGVQGGGTPPPQTVYGRSNTSRGRGRTRTAASGQAAPEHVPPTRMGLPTACPPKQERPSPSERARDFSSIAGPLGHDQRRWAARSMESPHDQALAVRLNAGP